MHTGKPVANRSNAHGRTSAVHNVEVLLIDCQVGGHKVVAVLQFGFTSIVQIVRQLHRLTTGFQASHKTGYPADLAKAQQAHAQSRWEFLLPWVHSWVAAQREMGADLVQVPALHEPVFHF